MTYHVLFNPLAGNGAGAEVAKQLKMENAEVKFHDVTKLDGYASFLRSIAPDDGVILTGGDGTINRFVNETEGMDIPNDILYYAVGTGNDFLNDLGKKVGEPPFSIKKYLRDLPTVTVKGKTCRFLNGIGYGIDGYCCEVGDQLREKSDKPVNYAAIAIKGLLFHFKPADAIITVDGREYKFRKVWLAPTMHGRFYGGGMMIAPQQDRLNAERTVTVSVLCGSGKLKTLMVFPSIFKGEHVKHTEMCKTLTGHEITVKFNRPTALQIDGETVRGVTEYSVTSKAPIHV
ncbi:MAG: diacylglycerol kinase family protein [Oscillospiraceae bacterium]|nr:diacylglycerol kinase family protein [Oscillospiraceae bacterium]